MLVDNVDEHVSAACCNRFVPSKPGNKARDAASKHHGV